MFRARSSPHGPWRALTVGVRAAAVLCLGFGRVYADDIGSTAGNVAVLDRPHPEWDPIGVRAGQFIAWPSLSAQVARSDNIFASRTGAQADAIFTIVPRLMLKSDWNQNAVYLRGEGALQRYASHSDQDSEQFSVGVGGGLNVRHDLTVFADASYARELIPRTSDAYARISLTPLLYNQTLARVRAEKKFNRLKISLRGQFEDYQYLGGETTKGGPLDESFRNRRSFAGEFRADYGLSGAVSLYAEETVVRESLDSIFRDQFQTQSLAGVNFEITRLITAEVGAGYLTSAYGGSPSPPGVGNFTERLKIQYFPTQLITVTLTGQQADVASGIPTSPAYNSKSLALEVDYELLRNLIITGQVSPAWNKYQVIQRYDRDLNASLGATYKLNHGLNLGVNFSRTQRGSSGAGAGNTFAGDNVLFSITLQK